jgi:hypothetical protein
MATKNKIRKTNPFKKLSVQENEVLLKFPAYISLLAANGDGIFDETEKKAAVDFAHIKSFSCHPRLAEFFTEADKVFENNLEQLDQDLPKEKDERDAAIKTEIVHLEKLALKLGREYASTLHRSMKTFNQHVYKAHQSVMVNFIFPLPIPGLSDN